MLKKIITNTYVIVGIILFVIMLAVLLWLKVSLGEALMASLALTIVGIGVEWWRENVW